MYAWEAKFRLFGETLDEWMMCQRTWLYLESIFSATDIQRQLPTEYRLFLSVDKTWRGNQFTVLQALPLFILQI